MPLLLLLCRRRAAAVAGDALLPAAPAGRRWRPGLAHLGRQQARRAPTHVKLGGGRRALLRRMEQLHVRRHAAVHLLTCCPTGDALQPSYANNE